MSGKHWTYLVLPVVVPTLSRYSSLQDTLNQYGSMGWELVAQRQIVDPNDGLGGSAACECIFKREET